MSELLKQAVDWSLKTIIVFVAGLQTVQNLILPAVDAFQRSLLTKAGSAIPAVGGLFGSVTELFFGSAALIQARVSGWASTSCTHLHDTVDLSGSGGFECIRCWEPFCSQSWMSG